MPDAPPPAHRSERDSTRRARRPGRRALGNSHLARSGELSSRRATRVGRAGARLRTGQARLSRDERGARPPPRVDCARPARGMHRTRARRAHRARRGRCATRRRGHVDEHERQRSARQPSPAAARPAARRLYARHRRTTTSTCTSPPTTPIPPPCGSLRSRSSRRSNRVVALRRSVPGQGEAVRRRRQSRPHAVAGRRARPRSDARWAPTPRRSPAIAGASTSARSGCASSTSAARPSAPASAPRDRTSSASSRSSASITGFGLGPRRKPDRGHAERRRLRRGQRHPQGAAPPT